MITKINDDLKQAMRDKNTVALNTLRALKSAFTNASLVKGNVNEELSPTEMVGIIRKQISQREDSIKQFEQSGRQDVQERIITEREEATMLKRLLPVDLTDSELSGLIQLTILEFENPSKKDMGNIIKKVQLLAGGKADGKRISSMVGSKLQ